MSSPAPALPFAPAPVILAVSAVLFGAMAVVARAASAELAAAQIASVRFALGLLLGGTLAAARPGTFRATRFDLLALRGLFGGAAVLGYFMAIERLSAGLATLLNYTFPLWAAVFAALSLGERFTRQAALGMAVATGGLVLVVGPDELARAFSGVTDPVVRWGLVCGLLSSVSGGAATTAVRAVRRTDSALAVFLAFCAGGLVVCVPLAVADWRPISPRAAGLLALVGLFSFGAQMLFTYSLKFVTAGAGSITTQLTVISSYLLAFLFLGEPLAPHVVLGGAVVLAGVLLASREERVPAPAAVGN